MDDKEFSEEPHLMVNLPLRIVELFASEGARGTGQIPWDAHWEIILACRDTLADPAGQLECA